MKGGPQRTPLAEQPDSRESDPCPAKSVKGLPHERDFRDVLCQIGQQKHSGQEGEDEWTTLIQNASRKA
jgi:hypothetical protein